MRQNHLEYSNSQKCRTLKSNWNSAKMCLFPVSSSSILRDVLFGIKLERPKSTGPRDPAFDRSQCILISPDHLHRQIRHVFSIQNLHGRPWQVRGWKSKKSNTFHLESQWFFQRFPWFHSKKCLEIIETQGFSKSFPMFPNVHCAWKTSPKEARNTSRCSREIPGGITHLCTQTFKTNRTVKCGSNCESNCAI